MDHGKQQQQARSHVRAAGVGEGVYVDDHIVYFIAPNSRLQMPVGPDKDIVEKSHQLYEEAGLIRSVAKGFGFADPEADRPIGLTKFTAWGTGLIIYFRFPTGAPTSIRLRSRPAYRINHGCVFLTHTITYDI